MKLQLLILLFFIAGIPMQAQVGIGNTSPNAALDISSTTTGLLIPRVALTSLVVEAPVLNPQGGSIPTSTLVYHDGSNAITAGFYYWDSAQWVMLTTGESNDWSITGNTGTTPATNFIGTLDPQDFVIKTNNTEKARIMSAGNLGVGIAAPIAKTHVFQAASATEDAILSQNLGTGNGLAIHQSNTGASLQAITVDQDGTGVFSRGLDIYMDPANISEGYLLFHDGTGAGQYMDLANAANTSIGFDLRHAGTGSGLYTDLSNAANASTGSILYHSGTGRGSYMNLDNTANTSTASAIIHDGTGTGQYIDLANTTTTGTALSLDHDGLGRGQQVTLDNTANTLFGLGIFHSGTGTGVYSESVGDAVYGYTTGTTATAGTFVVDNVAADTNSTGMFVVYDGTGGGGAGGGNALEVSHGGTNGNAVDIFLGDPSISAGPANTTSEYDGLTVAHMATGTSPTAGLSKSAISASNNSADPTLLVFNNGNEEGSGIESFVTPNTNDPYAIYGQSSGGPSAGYGFGVKGHGGWYGVYGDDAGGAGWSTYGVYSGTDLGATGAKTFLIDHPLDPENKALRHYSVESNEITNMYRGIVTLDATGQAVVKLPNYFYAANTEPSYQLTAIGTPIQPYVLKEVTNNQFTVAGKPNTKVSWTIYAKRNDPTIRYFNEKGKKYDQEEVNKPARMRGKYYTPEAYGKDKTQGIHYSENQEKTYSEKEAFVKQRKVMTPKRSIKKHDTKEAIEKREKRASKKKPKEVENKKNKLFYLQHKNVLINFKAFFYYRNYSFWRNSIKTS